MRTLPHRPAAAEGHAGPPRCSPNGRSGYISRPFRPVDLSGFAYLPYWGVLITRFCRGTPQKSQYFEADPGASQR